MKYLLVIATFSLSFTFTSAAFAGAVLIGQQTIGNNQLICYYKDYTSGDEYSKTAYGQCPAS